MNTQKVSFVRSAASKKDFLRDGRKSVVFAGRSNVGKSSVINCLLQRKNFARVGATPGKTVQVNYFLVDGAYFVDLPGYGYARVSGDERRRWGELMEDFFAEPERITLGVLIVDLRHDPTADDVTMAEYFKSSGRPYAVVANKLDKLKKSEIEPNLQRVRQVLDLEDGVAVIPMSSIKGTGRGELLSLIERMV
ncbi:MAG: YihA family ribosome biogenesis GTP-binding protein [Oscillospiraceae bacterium]|nr:YihA family ribosome biogenesis GTP-binding protein [Oscillospiraceae bacterium]